MANLDIKLSKLFTDEYVVNIENIIANNVKASIYRENIELLISFSKQEINTSGFSIEDIEQYLFNNKDEIINFGKKYLKHFSPTQLSAGVSITYTIYLLFLLKSPDELESYLIKRKIPNYKEILNLLKSTIS